jgi:hypothetical protein
MRSNHEERRTFQEEMRATVGTIRSDYTAFQEIITHRISRLEEIILADAYHRIQNIQEELGSI